VFLSKVAVAVAWGAVVVAVLVTARTDTCDMGAFSRFGSVMAMLVLVVCAGVAER
jgi:hypothetical protein